MTLKLPIYMDNHATTPVDPRVLEAMLPYFTQVFGNAASRSHSFGWSAEKAVEAARDQVGALIGASGKEIVWTSGATESDNLAIKGAAEFHKDRGNHIITAQTEHKAVLDTCKRLEKEGFEVTYLPVGKDGRVSAESVRAAMTDKTTVVSIMLANNEIGTVNPINEIGAVVKEKGAVFHVDAVQGAGKVPFDVNAARVDLASLSAHKMYGPKGVGALYVRRKPRVRITAQIDGGGHERGMRSGTPNVPGIVGLAKACELYVSEGDGESSRIRSLRDRLWEELSTKLEAVHLNGDLGQRLPGNLNVSFTAVPSDALIGELKEVAVSSGSACTSASLEPSYVLRAMGIDDERARASIRFGIGRFTTEEEIGRAASLVIDKVRALRERSPVWAQYLESAHPGAS